MENIRPGKDLELRRFHDCPRGLPQGKPSALITHATQEIESGALAKAFEPTAFMVCGLIFQCADLL